MKKLIGENIKIIRLGKGLTQKEAAERLGITTTAWKKFESGMCSFKVDTLEKIASALEVDLPDLFRKGLDVDTVKADHKRKELLSIYEQLNEFGRSRLLERGLILLELGYDEIEKCSKDGTKYKTSGKICRLV